MRSKTSIYASESEQTTQAMKILLRTDDFLTMVLNYLNNDKDAMYDSFLTSGQIIQNIFQILIPIQCWYYYGNQRIAFN